MGKELVFELPESVRKPLMDYLSTRPWREVAQGMDALMNLQTIPPVQSLGDPVGPDPDLAAAATEGNIRAA